MLHVISVIIMLHVAFACALRTDDFRGAHLLKGVQSWPWVKIEVLQEFIINGGKHKNQPCFYSRWLGLKPSPTAGWSLCLRHFTTSLKMTTRICSPSQTWMKHHGYRYHFFQLNQPIELPCSLYFARPVPSCNAWNGVTSPLRRCPRVAWVWASWKTSTRPRRSGIGRRAWAKLFLCFMMI